MNYILTAIRELQYHFQVQWYGLYKIITTKSISVCQIFGTYVYSGIGIPTAWRESTG